MSIESWVRSNIVILATVIILVAFIAISSNLFSSTLNNARITFKEPPIQKNKNFQLQPGEEYVYSYIFNGTGANITYVIYPGEGCTLIGIFENRNSTPACVDSSGMDSSGYNSSLDNPAIIIFKPWMLALTDGWKWNNSLYLTYDGGEEHISDTSYRVIRTETYMNRTSYVVEIKSTDFNSSSGASDYEWVDAEKRILLKIDSNDYQVRLVSGLPMNDS